MANITYRVGSCNVLYEYYYTKHSKVQTMPPGQRQKLWKDFVEGSTLQQCDILLLQEFSSRDPAWEDPLTNHYYDVRTSNTRRGNDSTCIAYRKRNFQLLGQDVLNFGSGKSAMKLLLRATHDNILITFVSAHVPWFPSQNIDGQVNVLQQLESFASKEIELEDKPGFFIDCLKHSTIVIGGDFNMRPDPQIYRPLLNPPPSSSQQQENSPASTSSCWFDLTESLDWTHMSGRGPSRLDFILQNTPPNPVVQGNVNRAPASANDLIKHDPLDPNRYGPPFTNFFSDHCFIGAEVSNFVSFVGFDQAVRSGPTSQTAGGQAQHQQVASSSTTAAGMSGGNTPSNLTPSVSGTSTNQVQQVAGAPTTNLSSTHSGASASSGHPSSLLPPTSSGNVQQQPPSLQQTTSHNIGDTPHNNNVLLLDHQAAGDAAALMRIANQLVEMAKRIDDREAQLAEKTTALADAAEKIKSLEASNDSLRQALSAKDNENIRLVSDIKEMEAAKADLTTELQKEANERQKLRYANEQLLIKQHQAQAHQQVPAHGTVISTSTTSGGDGVEQSIRSSSEAAHHLEVNQEWKQAEPPSLAEAASEPQQKLAPVPGQREEGIARESQSDSAQGDSAAIGEIS